ncbi:CBF/Mak21 family-domain-containing protein [Pilobolus umbonatus]|nr:CBF/Mak21 family-domain-containing protein [Pilobolus umbonatus]
MKIHKNVTVSYKNILIEPTPYWYNIPLPSISIKDVQRLSDLETSKKYHYARELLENENANAENHPLLTSSNRKFMANIITSGTLNDKVSALTLMLRESPIHGMKTMETLMSMCKKKGKNESVMAVTSLKDLFVGSVLPDRKLIYFADRPLAAKEVTDLHLLIWAFEDHLKKTFLEFIQLVEELSRDTLMHVRNNMVTCIYDLLSGKPEQEQNLLKLLINKLGDSENKVAAKTSQLIVELLVQHPGMKMFVVREVEQLLLRPNISEKAQYYAIISLNQTILTGKDTVVANKLVELYFIFFRKLLQLTEEEEKEELKNKNKQTEEVEVEEKKSDKRKAKEKLEKKKQTELEEHQTKMVAAILTGVNRAFHFSNISDDIVEKHLEVLFKMTHASTFNAAVQALSLIFTISLTKPIISDRFYRTLYESLLDPRVSHSSKQSMYLNLLYKAIRADSDMRRVKAYVKRMVQIAARNQPAFVTGIFFLLSQLMKSQPGLRTMLNTPEEDDEDEHFVDAPEEGEEEVKVEVEKKRVEYDGRKRDPRFSNADKSCLWELIPFREHYHPSVAKYCEQIFAGEDIEGQSDLHQFTLMHFLDKFVYRNAKKAVTTKGQSIMQPLEGSRREGVVFTRGGGMKPNSITLNSKEFMEKDVTDVSADDVFFHKYFHQKNIKTEQSKKKKAENEEDEEDEVWRAMMSSIPGGLDDEGDDDLLEDEDEDEDDDEMRALLEEDSEDMIEEEEGEDLEEGEDMSGDEDEDLEFMNASDMDESSNKRAFESSEEEEQEVKPKKAKKERLPTFATYEDYAKLIEQEEDE